MPRKTWRAALAAYASPSTLVLLLLGFAAGLPYMLVFSTLSVWLREAGVARETIGYASLIGLAYAFKWVWSPLLDQWRLPLLGKLGRRRSWLVLSQALVILGLIGKAQSWLDRMTQQGQGIGEIANAEQVSPGYVTRMLHLALLAPDIVQAIAQGRQPMSLNATKLMKCMPLPMDWEQQRTLLGMTEGMGTGGLQ